MRERERKREREKARERERERASWMPNAMVTAGNRAPLVEFPSSVLPVLWMCTTVFAWFTPSLMDCRVWSQVIALGGALSVYTVSCTSLTKKLLSSLQPFWPWLMWYDPLPSPPARKTARSEKNPAKWYSPRLCACWFIVIYNPH